MVIAEVKNILEKKLYDLGYLKDGQVLKDTDNLLDIGVDSMGLISIIVEMENETDILVPDEKLTMENFSTVNAFCRFFLTD
ncbi:acyl carrier protein [Metabacillus halosaccharovorans]|uniref:acyl carrier protein n=1 Tax=Metabacillus halosaccharovorans TaxID=930124 RepID=UPI00203D530B|nr:acyl carrier protein [Metabacillus halosaccharovorans]MCM3444733.1 acyl carrier protein [Metabacillus halosaccharovorans]